MQNLVNDTPAKKNYDFIDNIRSIAIMSIVMEHCFFFDQKMYHPTDQLSILTYNAVLQFIKFGTVAFFLLAGFLIGEKFTSYTPLQYMKRRIDSTIAPWLFWSLTFIAFIILNDIFITYRFNHGVWPDHYGLNVLGYFKGTYLYSSYWFIPNFLICIGLLLVFKRWLYSWKLGGVLLGFTVLYIINVYFEWIEPRHSTAILAFVFFLWLGAQFNRHMAAFEKWLAKTSIWLWAFLSVVTLIAGMWETSLLTKLHSIDPLNTLRPTNILYSLCFFFFLLKIPNYNFTRYIKPRETTYGIYLIHYILVYSILPIIFPTLRFGINSLSYGQVWLYLITRFIIAYGVTFVIVRLINLTKAKWLIGR